MQNSGDLLGGVLAALHGHILEFRIAVQLIHEGLLHCLDSVDNLWDEVQEALLPGKFSNKFLSYL